MNNADQSQHSFLGPAIPSAPHFYEMQDYVPELDHKVVRHCNSEYLHFSEKSRPHFAGILPYFRQVTFERAGVLHGEYMLCNGLILVGRDGSIIKANMALEDRWGANKAFDEFCNSKWFLSYKKDVLDQWETLPLVEAPIILSQPYAFSYFHWTLEAITKNRFFSGHPDKSFLIHANDLQYRFQRDLLVRTAGGRTVLTQNETATRIKDPILSHEIMSDNSIHWLREATKISGQGGGNRRIYLRRSSSSARERKGGSIQENLEFIAFLKEYAFEAIDFADLPYPVEQQVGMLAGASIILAPHGGALTNLAYLNPPLSVIEIIGPRTPRALFMHIASTLQFHYYGVYSAILDPDDNIVVDIEELRNIMRSLG